jgi:hypothetical protein
MALTFPDICREFYGQKDFRAIFIMQYPQNSLYLWNLEKSQGVKGLKLAKTRLN